MAGRVAYTGNIVTNGLVLNLDAGKLDSYPRSGTVWRDISGNGNDFTLIGSSTFSSLENIFTSTTSTGSYFIRNPFNHPTTAVTVEMWCLINNGATTGSFWSYAVTGGDNHNLLFGPGNISLHGPNSSPGAYINVDSGINIADGNWKQIVRTSNRSNGAETLYVNGISTFTTTINAGTNFTTGGSLILAQEQDSVGGGLDPTQALQGKYSNFKIYNRALTATEVSQNFNALRGRYGV